MELQRQPLSMTRALMPARLASMAQARPVGPAPTQIMSYVVIGVRFPRPLFGYYIGCRKICFTLEKSYINFQESTGCPVLQRSANVETVRATQYCARSFLNPETGSFVRSSSRLV